MKLRDYGIDQDREWFQQLLQWSQKKINVDDNWDCVKITPYINTSETRVGHTLGRIPQIIIPVMIYPYGMANLNFTREATIDTIFMTRATAGYQALIIL